MEIVQSVFAFILGVVSSLFGTLIGGGAFLLIPALIFMGLPAHISIGTSKVAALGLFIGGWYGFNKKGLIDYRISLLMIVPALLGSIIGSMIVFKFNDELLRIVIAVITISILMFIFFKPEVGIVNFKPDIGTKDKVLGTIFFFIIYVYLGFYGAGAGTFLSYVLILLFGQTFIESAATNKIPSLAAMLISTIIFAANNAIHYSLGAFLFAGSLIGSYVSAQYADRIGNVWIKRFFFALVLLLSLKLLF